MTPGTLSTSQIIATCATQLVQGIQITLPYTIAVYMVRDYNKKAGLLVSSTEDEQRVAQLTGMLAACFMAAQFFTSYAWGCISDKVGRKPVVVIGNLVCALSIVAFGGSDTYGAAAVSRFVGGFFNGIFGALKTIIADHCSADGQAKALSYISLSWGMGCIVAPIIGGVFSGPCDRLGDGFPLCQPGQLLSERPYLLPCVVAGLMTLVATLLSQIFLTETLPGGAKWTFGLSGLCGAWRRVTGRNAGGYSQVATEDDDAMQDGRGGHVLELVEVCTQKLKLPGDSPRSFHRCDSAVSSPHASQDTSADQLSWLRQKVDAARLSTTQHPATRHDSATSVPSVSSDDDGHEKATLQTLEAVPDSEDEDGRGVGQGRTNVDQAEAAAVYHAWGLERPTAGPLSMSPDGGPQQYGKVLEFHPVPGKDVGPAVGHKGAACGGGIDSAKSLCLPEDQESNPGQGIDSVVSICVPEEHSQSEHCRHGDGDDDGDDDDDDDDCEKCGLLQSNTSAAKCSRTKATTQGSRTYEYDDDRPWYRNRAVIISLSGYALSAFLFSFLDEGTPLFAATPASEGGLGWATDDLAWPLAFGGACLMLFALLAYPRVQKRLGVVRTCRLGLILVLPFAQLGPLASLLPNHTAQQIMMFASTGLRSMAGTMAFTSSMIMVNLSSPRSHIGEINGVGQMLAALFRAIGPAVCGLLWSASMKVDIPGHQFLLFIIGGTVALLTQFLYRWLHIPGLM